MLVAGRLLWRGAGGAMRRSAAVQYDGAGRPAVRQRSTTHDATTEYDHATRRRSATHALRDPHDSSNARPRNSTRSHAPQSDSPHAPRNHKINASQRQHKPPRHATPRNQATRDRERFRNAGIELTTSGLPALPAINGLHGCARTAVLVRHTTLN